MRNTRHRAFTIATIASLAVSGAAATATAQSRHGHGLPEEEREQAQEAMQRGEQMSEQQKQRMMRKLQDMAPALGYLKAHRDVAQPSPLLGGPLTVTVTQTIGGVHVALPAQRKIDERVFGTPQHPQRIGGTPVITGLPPMMRQAQNGKYTTTTNMTPFGDKAVVMKNGRLDLRVVDATATDAATSEDAVSFEASWEDEAGDIYKVTCSAVMPHGLEYPTFGGVVTNHLMHGVSGVGTPLMPTMFTYAAFWGTGDVMKNGEVIDAGRAVHGMLTEYVRTEGYSLGFDEDVTPTRRHFHLMVAPMAPDPESGHFTKDPVQTGFTLPNGKPLPFWHVMFQNLEISAERGG